MSPDKLHSFIRVVNRNGEVAQAIADAARISTGRDVSEEDTENIMLLAKHVIMLTNCRKDPLLPLLERQHLKTKDTFLISS